MLRRVLVVCLLAVSAAALPVWAGAPADTQPQVITGTYKTTNPIYPSIGATTGAVLYDLTGNILEDYAFQSPPEAQVLGQLDGDIVSGSYRIELPARPQATFLDFDGDATTPPAVQVFVTGTYINIRGDEYINRGESPLDVSVRIDPMSFDIVGGHVIVWTAHEGEQFPGGMGPDGVVFTGDDPLMALPAGWSVISLDADPFTIIRDETVDVPIIESVGALNDYSDESYLEAWDRLFQRTRETYPFTADKAIDWNSVYKQITPLIKRASSDLEFGLGIANFGSLIPDTHVGYGSVDVMRAFLVGGVGISRMVVTDDGEVVILGVEPDTPAAAAGIQPQDILVTVDGTPALQVLDETPLLLNSASTEHGRRYLQAATMLQGPLDSRVTLTWRAADGTEYTQTLTRVFDISSITSLFALDDDEAPVITARLLDSGIGYIRVRSFAEEVSQADALFANALQDLVNAGASGIVLDVRGNGGGLVQLSMSMAGHFFSDYIRLFDLYYADGQGEFAFRGSVEVLESTPHYDGPVAVLVDEMTGSAADMFVYAMQTDSRAVVVGHTPTAGFTGEVSNGQYILPGNVRMQIPTGRTVDPLTGITLLEGTGVLPNVQVPRTRISLASPEDEVLLAAEAALLGQHNIARHW
jgi:C-terminal peptidase prc